jgi:hypothetical protein
MVIRVGDSDDPLFPCPRKQGGYEQPIEGQAGEREAVHGRENTSATHLLHGTLRAPHTAPAIE